MKKFQYIISDPDGSMRETWVCSKCKKDNNGLILKGKWKLIGRSNGDYPCELCGLDKIDDKACGN